MFLNYLQKQKQTSQYFRLNVSISILHIKKQRSWIPDLKHLVVVDDKSIILLRGPVGLVTSSSVAAHCNQLNTPRLHYVGSQTTKQNT